MAHLIDKSALVAELEKNKNEMAPAHDWYFDEYTNGYVDALKEALSIINTLEVKEVDLDREIRRYRMRNPIIQHREESLYDYMANVAKYFFELGLKAQKGEEV